MSGHSAETAYVRPRVPVFDDELPPEAVHMLTPVLCTHCRAVYELGRVEVVNRYADCSLFIAPCCKRTVDDRRFKSLPDITRLNRRKPQRAFLAEVERDDMNYPPESTSGGAA